MSWLARVKINYDDDLCFSPLLETPLYILVRINILHDFLLNSLLFAFILWTKFAVTWFKVKLNVVLFTFRWAPSHTASLLPCVGGIHAHVQPSSSNLRRCWAPEILCVAKNVCVLSYKRYKVDYSIIYLTPCPGVFYFSYTTAICQPVLLFLFIILYIIFHPSLSEVASPSKHSFAHQRPRAEDKRKNIFHLTLHKHRFTERPFLICWTSCELYTVH